MYQIYRCIRCGMSTPNSGNGKDCGACRRGVMRPISSGRLSRGGLIKQARQIEAANRISHAQTVSIYGRIAMLLDRGLKESRAKRTTVESLIDKARHEAADECAIAPETIRHHILTQLADALESDLKSRFETAAANMSTPCGWTTIDEIHLVERLAGRRDAPSVLRRYLCALEQRTNFEGLDVKAIELRVQTLLRLAEREAE
ncbi:hypothetical protein G3N95_16235 [Paraburkholderia sp. Tr-20389]|uniref:hypothetical protein n=1 Tax=Paraburkholderia sp. Tr-20389 TaxID=2703903 RepID=UPI001981242D|nr:hypothetical protein [Paraburkholderia sp. Tr-20389]MBN3754499.1 hypothetical protein [Paraburkholderia sp. Tr-20389]